MELSLNKEFLKRLENWGITEISNLTKNLWWLEIYDNVINQRNGLYFVSYLPNALRCMITAEKWKPQRSRDEFVSWISYVKMDLDIRKYIYLHENRIITDDELLALKDKVLEWLRQDELLSSYTAVVHSGNGIHIYWIGDMVEIDAKTYSAASKYIYDHFKELFPADPCLWPDYATANISSLMRLPGSLNSKKDYGLPSRRVEIIEYNEEDSPLVGRLNELWTKYLKEQALKVKKRTNEMDKKSRWCFSKSRRSTDLYHRINEDVNIAELVCAHTWWVLAENWINFISQKDGKYTGAYIIPDENVVVHMGTPHIKDDFRVYSPFSFILVHYCDWNPLLAFRYALMSFPAIRHKGRFYFSRQEEDGRRTHKYSG